MTVSVVKRNIRSLDNGCFKNNDRPETEVDFYGFDFYGLTACVVCKPVAVLHLIQCVFCPGGSSYSIQRTQ